MYQDSKTTLVEQITGVVEKLPKERQKKVLYLARLQQAAVQAKQIDQEGKKIKGKRPSLLEIDKIVKRNRAKKRAG